MSNDIWSILDDKAAGIGYEFENDCWIVYQEDGYGCGLSILGTISLGLIPELDSLAQSLTSGIDPHTFSTALRPSTKERFIKQVESDIRDVWRFINPKYKWLACDYLGEEFSWRVYTHMPDSNSESAIKWTSIAHSATIDTFFIEIPLGIGWRDLRFQRPSDKNKEE